jgi:anti-sigma B factor antagonist
MAEDERDQSRGSGRVEAEDDVEGFSAYWEEMSGASVLRIRGDLDLSSSAALRACLVDEVYLDGPPIVIDLSDVQFVDSTCLGVLIAAARHAKSSRGALLLAAPRPRVQRALEIAALDGVLPLHPSVDEAAAAAEKGV